MNLPDDILIVGLGMTGVATAHFLAKWERRLPLSMKSPNRSFPHLLKLWKAFSFQGSFGSHRREDFLAHPLIIISPGVDNELPLLREAKEMGIKVIGEMELAFGFIDEPIIAITGTNGKTTVTTLVGEIFRRAFGEVFVGGNIGDPLINYVLKGSKARYIIIEVSSFQLDSIEAFRPQTSILLNITEDHLDRYRSFAEYRDAKCRIFETRKKRTMQSSMRIFLPLMVLGRKNFSFSSKKEVQEGSFLNNEMMVVRFQGQEHRYERILSPLAGFTIQKISL